MSHRCQSSVVHSTPHVGTQGSARGCRARVECFKKSARKLSSKSNVTDDTHQRNNVDWDDKHRAETYRTSSLRAARVHVQEESATAKWNSTV